MEPIKLTIDASGNYCCDVPVSKRQWVEFLNNGRIIRAEWLRVLLSFYFMPGHKATCAACAAMYGHSINIYNTGITSVGRAVTKELGTFIIENNDGEQCYWPVAVSCGRYVRVDGAQQFEWTLRKELIEAISQYLIDNAVKQYAEEFADYWKNEQYKWQAVQWFQQHWHIEDGNFASMIEFATAKTANLLASMNSFPRGMIVQLAKLAPSDVRDMFVKLYDENCLLEERVQQFIVKAEELRQRFNSGDWKLHYQSTNAISVYLWLRYPDKYYVYKYSEYRSVADKLGLDFVFKKNGHVSELMKGYSMYNMLNTALCENDTAVAEIHKHLSENSELYYDAHLKTATIDFGFWISRRYKSVRDSLFLKTPVTMTPFISQASALLKNKKNIILQGAPGTGKTYNTAALALAVIDGTVPENHHAVMTRYEQLRKERRIGFTTFHQSMDYEDFIEGIKPEHDGASIRYKVEDGIFKTMCNEAKVASEIAATGTVNLLEGMNENPTIWKVSLESTGDNATRRDCMKNGHIRIGWAEYGDMDFTEDNQTVTEGKGILRTFQNDMRIGDIVVSCWSANETDAIGIVTGDYEYRPEGGNLPRYRDVRWIVKGIRHDIREINNGKRMTLGTVYRLSITLTDIINVINAHTNVAHTVADSSEKPYVLIIDEINRGNVSKIFGELITLLEKDKRLGDNHPITLTLPYSKTKDFGVPQNLYIIGTMNTTDRSTGTIDYAIRRRFAFVTIPADREVIDSEVAQRLFDNVKLFIERYKYADMDIDDLMVGHSYFMTDSDDELSARMYFEVIPLVKEYIKDGILSVRPDEARRYFDAWQRLDTIDDTAAGTSED